MTEITLAWALDHALEVIEFDVAGDPHGRPRPRSRAIKTKKGTWTAMAYQPKKIDPNSKKSADREWLKANAWEASMHEAMRGNVPLVPWDGAVYVAIDVFKERPKYLNKKSSPDGAILCTTRPDRDNVEKAVTDPMAAAGVFTEDSRVCCGPVTKWYAAKGYGPGVHVTAIHLGDPVELARRMEARP
jgi:Holliday junction resolvase RusA-like endonuclease